jgi:hypothetical protein
MKARASHLPATSTHPDKRNPSTPEAVAVPPLLLRTNTNRLCETTDVAGMRAMQKRAALLAELVQAPWSMQLREQSNTFRDQRPGDSVPGR